MDEYIKREGLLRKFNIDDMMNVNGTLISLREARETISNFPAADVAPVRHGKWDVMSNTKTRRICSCCGWDVPEYGKFYSYCPNCGARMDGAE